MLKAKQISTNPFACAMDLSGITNPLDYMFHSVCVSVSVCICECVYRV